MASSSMASPSSRLYFCSRNYSTASRRLPRSRVFFLPRISLSENQQQSPEPEEAPNPIPRREIVLRSSELAVVGAIFNLSGKKPEYLGVQKNPPSLALCPATKNCISTSESITDLTHYAPPWNYNGGRGRKQPISREEAKKELLDVIKSTKPGKFTPQIVEDRDDYVRVEYQSPILGLVDDVEFWFPPGKNPIVEYRSASRVGNFDFDYNRKRIKALREELEKKGWASEDSF
ncbi:hypothetical protein CRG98_012524 [Punica granatum]|uniref:DUF1499 domain-containing protein n=1 Tax=Punica granatum TaxID=22663 RepID=A0A2I0KFY7_PUNGR|nr:hypothetical protein CRG98_012524 [Punica granatum]